jgi:type II secretory pathway predicted ATPase ExeA
MSTLAAYSAHHHSFLKTSFSLATVAAHCCLTCGCPGCSHIQTQLEQVEDDLDAQQTLLQQANLRSVAELQKQLRETQEHLQRYV